MSRSRRDIGLAVALATLAVMFVWWFRQDPHWLATLLVFVIPPVLLLVGVLCGRAGARFWAGVLALLWFSHGVMHAWMGQVPPLLPWLEIVLALAIIALVSVPGMRARFGKRRPQ